VCADRHGRVPAQRSNARAANITPAATRRAAAIFASPPRRRGPAAAILHAVKLLGGSVGTVLEHTHSGMVSGDDDAVVGYAGMIAA